MRKRKIHAICLNAFDSDSDMCFLFLCRVCLFLSYLISRCLKREITLWAWIALSEIVDIDFRMVRTKIHIGHFICHISF